jgi:hypothetical protein
MLVRHHLFSLFSGDGGDPLLIAKVVMSDVSDDDKLSWLSVNWLLSTPGIEKTFRYLRGVLCL